MKNLEKLLKNEAILKALPTMANGEYCFNHIPPYKMPKVSKDGELEKLQQEYRIQKIIVADEIVCPQCACDAETEKTKQSVNEELRKAARVQKMNILHEKSLIHDETIKYAKFETYQPGAYDDEAHRNKALALEYVEMYKQGLTFNVIFAGNVGAGKSGLSMSMLKALRNEETSCLFISVRLMFDLLYDSFDNKESKYTLRYFTDLLTAVDFLVLDDIGAETSSTASARRASDYVSKTLCGILEGRQHKSTIITTNLTFEQMIEKYDTRLTDRIKRNKKVIKFVDTKSFRDRSY